MHRARIAEAVPVPPGAKHFADRNSWRAWLERHHATSKEMWLIMFKKASGKRSISYDEAVEEALCFGWIDSVARGVDEMRRAQRFSPRKDPTTWSPSNLERMKRLQAEGRVTPAGLAKFRPDPKKGAPKPRASDRAPRDLAAALLEVPAAKAFWATLAPGYRRNFVAWITEAKKPETRARRVQKAVEHLRKGVKEPSMGARASGA